MFCLLPAQIGKHLSCVGEKIERETRKHVQQLQCLAFADNYLKLFGINLKARVEENRKAWYSQCSDLVTL